MWYCEDTVVEVGEYEDASRCGIVAPMDDLEVAPIANNDEDHGDDTKMKMKIMWRRTMIILCLI